ncbi:DEAD/DEAH box helicase family protein [Bradyrhizobium sp. NDS-1]|uniref:DEAD/DEAH box helicase family protein n=1 Tax=Bradyrhizobium sp. NDS-1 TaxID=3080014 RepID=UPI00293E4E24|nr:DEAD/DEAH box helicase family protein [Bradyrhizobium sp. NDS-1]WOH75548.1 DEAD/DEAH box helicase family protein [Bradyrhizobium sp. NDS-1]
MLKDLNLKAVYQSDEDDLLRDFYIPALSQSVQYDRAVGFFSGSMLSFAAQGISAFVAGNGRMRLVVGGELDEEDVAAIQSGYDTRILSEKIGRQLLRVLDNVDDDLFQTRIELLSWLVAGGHLDIKVALKRRGMYHAKVGIMRDANGDGVVFQGSANETVYALLPDFNFETMNVFPTWRPELAAHFEPHVAGFERLWKNRSPGTVVIDFPDAVRERFIRIAKRSRVADTDTERALWEEALQRYMPSPARSQPSLPKTLGGRPFAIMPHQRRALEAWRASDCQGILALATGAGKTVTAIYAAVQFFKQTNRLCLIVAVPYQSLADQWVENLRIFSIQAFACYGGTARWRDDVAQALHLFEQGAAPFICLVVVNKTLTGEVFQHLLKNIPGDRMLWVGDECHHHGSVSNAASLPDQAQLRLGLSATPDHYLNAEANLRLNRFYGRVVDTYDLRQALEDGVLTPYRYQVELVDLTEDETDRYLELSERIGRLIGRSPARLGEGNPELDRLLFERARVLGGASNKMNVLDRLLRGQEPTAHTLFYCSDASTDSDEDNSAPQRQVEAVSQRLHDLGWRASRFTAREATYERRMILDGFRLGDLEAMVAIRCLDEGIDVPACQKAFILASSRNPRQFIQRRGRILRRSPGKHFAEIVDLMVRIPDGLVERSDVERALLEEELKRVAEFARLARNSGDVIETLMPLLVENDLTHCLV